MAPLIEQMAAFVQRRDDGYVQEERIAGRPARLTIL